MLKIIYLHLLIFCGISCQGIFAALSNEDTKESSDFLLRKKRVISHLPSGLSPTSFNLANYMVNIKENNRSSCVGVILSHYTVLTAASCIGLPELTAYKVLSGSGYDVRSIVHNVTSKVEYFGYLPHQSIDGIALITVDPLFVFSRNTGFIELHEGALRQGTQVTVRGWGCGYPLQPAPEGIRRRLRSIILPIMNHQECENDYQHFYLITVKHICTYHAQQYCARTDVGAPLIFNNMLAGIHVFKGHAAGQRNPDVFVDLTRVEYSTWIREHTILM